MDMKTRIIFNEIEPKYFATMFGFILALPSKGIKIEKIEFPEILSSENFEFSDELNLKSKMGTLTWEDMSNSLKNPVSMTITCQNNVNLNDLEHIRKLCDCNIEERLEENKIIFWPKNREAL